MRLTSLVLVPRWRLEGVARWLATSRGLDIAFGRRRIHAYSGARLKTEPET